MADYMAKVQAGNRLTRHDLDSLTATPHPNDHLEMMSRTAETLAPHTWKTGPLPWSTWISRSW